MHALAGHRLTPSLSRKTDFDFKFFDLHQNASKMTRLARLFNDSAFFYVSRRKILRACQYCSQQKQHNDNTTPNHLIERDDETTTTTTTTSVQMPSMALNTAINDE
jgi:hypothetical protein